MVQSLEDVRRQRNTGARVPPHDLAAEASLLGAMLLSPNAIGAAAEVRLAAADFYKPAHGHIYEAIEALYHRGDPADPVTVADELHRDGLLEAIGGAATLVSLQAGTPAISNAARYARIVEEFALLRRLINVAGEIADLGYSLPDDVATVVDRAETLVFEVNQRRLSDDMIPVSELLASALDKLEALYERGEAITGVPTGYDDLDHRLAGLQPNNLIVVGARPAMGKTSFALGILAHAAMEANVPTLFFSLEMGRDEITQRLLCSEARVDATKLRTGRFDDRDWQKVSAAVGRLGEAPIFIDDNPNITVMDIRAKARRLKARENLGLIVIDYIQLMTGRSHAESRQVEVAEMSRGLKILARELQIPVVALSQLSRGLESRQDKRPMLSDLRESGSLEQDADVVMFLYRDDMYNPESNDKGMAEIIVSKHRSGPTGVTQLAFLEQYTRFENMARHV
jgi:replicative DNA helicase